LVRLFVLGRPAHRIVAALAPDGLPLDEGTLAGVFAACSMLLAPLAGAISDRNAAAGHLHVDETRWNVYAAVEGKDSHRWCAECSSARTPPCSESPPRGR
jgi:transposase